MGTQIGLTGIVFGDGSTQNTAITVSGGNATANTYTSPGTWTKQSGLKSVKVTVVGGGAGGSGVGGAGGAGGTSILWVPAPTLPANGISVTIGTGGAGAAIASGGAGGTSSFGVFASATGGALQLSPFAQGSDGGLGSGGTVNIQGGAGGNQGSPIPAGKSFVTAGGNGGNSVFGGGGRGGSTPVGTGTAGGNFGGGGGGGGPGNGAAGAAGVVIVEEFY